MSTLRVNNIQFNTDGNTVIAAVNTNNIVITVDGTEKLKAHKDGFIFRGPVSVNNTPIFDGSGSLLALPTPGTSGNVFTSNGTSWVSQAPIINLSTQVNSVLNVASGGTGLSAVGTSGNVLTSNGTAWVSQALSNTFASPNFTGNIYANGSYRGNLANVAALDIDCSLSNYFIKTISTGSTFTFSNVAASSSYAFTLEVNHTSGTITWPAAVKWPADTAPTLTTGKVHLFIFSTDDGGTIWRGSSLINYAS